jgi:hypothetical protein
MKKIVNIWDEGGLYYQKNALHGNVLERQEDLFEEFTLSNFTGLADAAEQLASNSIIMDFYSHFEKGTYGFFFSPNPNLNSATKRPLKFDSWHNWDSLAPNQKRTLAVLGGFKEDATDIIRNATDFDKLKQAFSEWPATLFSVFWQNEKFRGVWTCNIFVGDSIYLWKKISVVNENRHYYEPSSIKAGKGPFVNLSTDNAKRGAIVVFGDSHTEVITSTITYLFADKGFCSIGAGRGNRNSTGTIRCDNSLTPFESREIEDPNNSYYTL